MGTVCVSLCWSEPAKVLRLLLARCFFEHGKYGIFAVPAGTMPTARVLHRELHRVGPTCPLGSTHFARCIQPYPWSTVLEVGGKDRLDPIDHKVWHVPGWVVRGRSQALEDCSEHMSACDHCWSSLLEAGEKRDFRPSMIIMLARLTCSFP